MKIMGLGNDEKFNWIIVKKDSGFFEWLNELLTKSFGFVSPDINFYETKNLDGKIITEKRDIEECTDLHEYYGSEEGSRIDVFYGKEKIFITILTSLEKRKRLMEILENLSEFEE